MSFSRIFFEPYMVLLTADLLFDQVLWEDDTRLLSLRSRRSLMRMAIHSTLLQLTITLIVANFSNWISLENFE